MNRASGTENVSSLLGQSVQRHEDEGSQQQVHPYNLLTPLSSSSVTNPVAKIGNPPAPRAARAPLFVTGGGGGGSNQTYRTRTAQPYQRGLNAAVFDRFLVPNHTSSRPSRPPGLLIETSTRDAEAFVGNMSATALQNRGVHASRQGSTKHQAFSPATINRVAPISTPKIARAPTMDWQLDPICTTQSNSPHSQSAHSGRTSTAESGCPSAGSTPSWQRSYDQSFSPAAFADVAPGVDTTKYPPSNDILAAAMRAATAAMIGSSGNAPDRPTPASGPPLTHSVISNYSGSSGWLLTPGHRRTTWQSSTTASTLCTPRISIDQGISNTAGSHEGMASHVTLDCTSSAAIVAATSALVKAATVLERRPVQASTAPHAISSGCYSPGLGPSVEREHDARPGRGLLKGHDNDLLLDSRHSTYEGQAPSDLGDRCFGHTLHVHAGARSTIPWGMRHDADSGDKSSNTDGSRWTGLRGAGYASTDFEGSAGLSHNGAAAATPACSNRNISNGRVHTSRAGDQSRHVNDGVCASTDRAGGRTVGGCSTWGTSVANSRRTSGGNGSCVVASAHTAELLLEQGLQPAISPGESVALPWKCHEFAVRPSNQQLPGIGIGNCRQGRTHYRLVHQDQQHSTEQPARSREEVQRAEVLRRALAGRSLRAAARMSFADGRLSPQVGEAVRTAAGGCRAGVFTSQGRLSPLHALRPRPVEERVPHRGAARVAARIAAAAHDPWAMLLVVGEETEAFSAASVASTFHQLASCQDLQASRSSGGTRDGPAIGSGGTGNRSGNNSGSGGVVTMRQAVLADIRFKTLEQLAAAKVCSFGAQQLCSTLWALAKLGHRPDSLLTVLCSRLPLRMDEALPQHVSNAIWALGTLGFFPGEVVMQVLAARALLVDLQPQNISNVLLGTAKLGWQPGSRWLESIASMALASLSEFSAQSLANTAWSYARLGYDPTGVPLVDALLREAGRRVHLLNPQNIANTVYAVALLDHSPPGDGVLDTLLLAAANKMREFSPQNVSNIVWACGKLRHHHGAVLQAAAQFATSRINRLGSQSVANLTWGFARLEHGPGASYLEAVAAHLLAHSSQYPPQHLANTLWALATLAHYSAKLMDVVADALVRRLQLGHDASQFENQHVAIILWAYGTLQHPHPRLVKELAGLAGQVLRGNGSCSPQEVANMVWALARLAHYDEALMDLAAQRFVMALECASGPECLPQHMSMMSWACNRLTHLHRPLMEALASAATQRMLQLSDQNLSVLIGAFAVLLPEPSCPHSQQPASQPQPSQLQPSSPVTTPTAAASSRLPLYARRRNGHQHLPCSAVGTFLDTAVAEVHDRVTTLSLPQVCHTLWALTMVWRCTPGLWALLVGRLGCEDAPGLAEECVMQLYQAYMNMCVDHPPSSITLGPPSMMEAGRRLWLEAAQRPYGSRLHSEVSMTLLAAGVDHRNEAVTDDGLLSIDIAVTGSAAEARDSGASVSPEESSHDASGGLMRIALEIDGPSHFTANTREPLGTTLARRRSLAARGWRVVSLPYWEWAARPTGAERQQLLHELIG